ncbi:TPA: hypothetical protein N0F65_008899, partial [Lagenidium giganteum]
VDSSTLPLLFAPFPRPFWYSVSREWRLVPVQSVSSNAKTSGGLWLLQSDGSPPSSSPRRLLSEYAIMSRQQASTTSYFTVNAAAKNMYRWLEWIVMDGLPLTFCEKRLATKNTSLQPICSKTLKRYREIFETSVQKRVAESLRDKVLGRILDAWTEAGTHFVAVFAIAPDEALLVVHHTLENEADMGSDSMMDLLDESLDQYGIDLAQLCFFVCDNASVNVTDVALVDCIPTARETMQLKSLHGDLQCLESVNKLLQANSTTLREVRAGFDSVVSDYPGLQRYLASNVDIVKLPEFEAAIVKILRGQDHELTAEEIQSVQTFSRRDDTAASPTCRTLNGSF